ncbi:MAG: zinc-ribbon domain-containing protein [Solobacterium sp.]|nr:zinc-ribbon domain-containing protein [Solobacterium sp.]
MICEKCGAVLPEDATFCGECGAKVVKKKKNPAALEKAKAQAKRYKISSIILACLCIVLTIGWAIASQNPYRNIDNYEKEAVEVERAGIELTGTYVVGEDSELPEGRYNIYPAEGESYVDVDIYETMEDAKKKYTGDYQSLAIAHIYSMVRGYKLKAGQIVVIDYGSAFFELVSEEPVETEEPTETESTEATDVTDASAAEPSESPETPETENTDANE